MPHMPIPRLPGSVSGASKACLAFPSVSFLPSTGSADSTGLSLFAGFFGTTKLSDSPETYTSDVGLKPSPTDPLESSGCFRGLPASARSVSNRACGLRLRGGDIVLACFARHRCCLPHVRTRSARQTQTFSELNTQPGCASVNASPCRLPDTPHHSRPRWLARPSLVRLFHSRRSSGFCRRTLTPFVIRPRGSAIRRPQAASCSNEVSRTRNQRGIRALDPICWFA